MRPALVVLALAAVAALALPAGASGGADPAVPHIVRPLWESDVGASVAVVYRAVAPGKATLTSGLTRGETYKAYASMTYTVTVLGTRTAASAHASLARFRTPSDFIRCTYAPAPMRFVRCDARRSYSPAPPAPKGCRVQGLDWANAFRLQTAGRAFAYCHGDTAFGSTTPPVLGYGRSWSRDGVTCSSRRTGLTCTNRAGHGFVLTDTSWRMF